MTVSPRDDTATFPQRFAAGWLQHHDPPEWCTNPDSPPGPCALCGGHDTHRWRWRPGENFADHDRVARPDQTAICSGCRLLSQGGPERNERGNWRKWTLYTLATNTQDSRVLLKDRKPEIRQLILNGWAVAINDSGKKHVGFWGPVPNTAYLPVTFDRDPLWCTPAQFRATLELCDTLYTAGIGKTSLETADPTAAERKKAARSLTHPTLWQLLNQLRATPPLVRRCAAWLAQKEEE